MGQEAWASAPWRTNFPPPGAQAIHEAMAQAVGAASRRLPPSCLLAATRRSHPGSSTYIDENKRQHEVRVVNRLLYCKFLPLRLGICRRWSSSWILASQSTRSAPLAFREGPGLPLLPPAFLPTESLASRLLLGVGIDWLQRCSATAATRDCISADAVRPPRATVLLALVTSATREDIVRLLKGARAPSYKIPVRASNNRPRQGEDQGRGVAGSRNTSLRVSTVSTCNALRGLFSARQALPPPACGRAKMKRGLPPRASLPPAGRTQ